MEFKHLYFFFISVSHFYLALSGQVNSLESVPDLENSMYLTLAGYPCVRLLNLTGEIGCANPGREKVVAPVVRLKDVDKLTSPSAVLVSQDEMEDFFSSVLNDHHFAKKVAGVLVESGTKVPTAERGFSPVEKFPQVKFAPYKNVDYIWNPAGSNIMWNKYDFPVFLLSQDSTVTLQEIAGKNEKNKRAYSVDVTEFDLVMQTTKAGTHDSESCLRQQSCLPLGGYSVLSSLPPISITSGQPKPILLVVASMDSASFFRDKSPGADSPLSGMISLLAAVDALSHIDGVNDLKKQEIEKYKLGNPQSFRYLNQLNCYELVGVSDAHEYLATRRAMDITGITEAEQDSIFKVVAVIHHLGNIKFDKGEESDSSILKDETSNFHLHMTAKLLMCLYKGPRHHFGLVKCCGSMDSLFTL